MRRFLPLDGLIDVAKSELDEPPWRVIYHQSEIAARVAKFRNNQDGLSALLAARDALGRKDYVPRAIAEWLSLGISLYVHGRRRSLEEALGLSKPGRASPLRRAKEERELRGALGRMYELNLLGATVPQAAVLVAAVTPAYSMETLIDRYRRGGYYRGVRELLNQDSPPFDPTEVLKEYPDEPLDVVQAKAAIRAMYDKRRR